MQKINGIVLVFLLLVSHLVIADQTASTQLMERLSAMKSFQADFVQTVVDGQGNLLQSTTGEMAVLRPGLFYWQAHPPLEQLVVSDGRQLWSYDPDLEQVTVQPMDERLTQTPALLLSGEVEKLADSYQVSRTPLGKALVQFRLTPQNPESLFETLRLTFDGRTLVQMNLQDSLGQHSSLEFRNVKINADLDKTLFEFTPPDGVDVIIQ